MASQFNQRRKVVVYMSSHNDTHLLNTKRSVVKSFDSGQKAAYTQDDRCLEWGKKPAYTFNSHAKFFTTPVQRVLGLILTDRQLMVE